MTNIQELLRQKEQELARLQKEVEALRIAADLLAQSQISAPAPAAAVNASPPAPAAAYKAPAPPITLPAAAGQPAKRWP